MALNAKEQILVDAYKSALQSTNTETIKSAAEPILTLITKPDGENELDRIGKVIRLVNDYIDNFLVKFSPKPTVLISFDSWLKTNKQSDIASIIEVLTKNPLFIEFKSVLQIVSPITFNLGTTDWIAYFFDPVSITTEYSVSEVGCIGAISGSDGMVIPIGRTIRVLNLPITAEIKKQEQFKNRINRMTVTRVDGKREIIKDRQPPKMEVYFATNDRIRFGADVETQKVLSKLSYQYNKGLYESNTTNFVNPVQFHDGNEYSSPPFAPRLKTENTGDLVYDSLIASRSGKPLYQLYNYKIGRLSNEMLQQIEEDTNISAAFLSSLDVIWLEQENYPNQPGLSYVPLFPTWPKNLNGQHINNIDQSYKDSWNTSKVTMYPKFIFLVEEDVLNALVEFFQKVKTKPIDFAPTQYTDVIPKIVSRNEVITPLNVKGDKTVNPLEFLTNRGLIIRYGQQYLLNYQEDLQVENGKLMVWFRDVVLPKLGTTEIYRMNNLITDINFATDIVASQLFFQLYSNWTNIAGNMVIDEVTFFETYPVLNNQIDLIQKSLTESWRETNSTGNSVIWKTINLKLLVLLKDYLEFVRSREYPTVSEISVVKSQFGIIDDFRYRRDFEGGPVDELGFLIDDGVTESGIESEWIPTANYAYKGISKGFDYISNEVEYKSSGLFKCIGERMNTFFTGSAPPSHSKYYIPIYNNIVGGEDSYHQFDISFAHKAGSGSSFFFDDAEYYPSKTMYKKYLLECLGRSTGEFTFKNNKSSDYFYIIQFDQDSFKDRIDPGNIQITLAPISSSQNQLINTGSNFSMATSSGTIFTLIDDSSDEREEITVQADYIQDYYYLVSGSIQQGTHDDSSANAWGVIFPRTGLIILDGTVLDQSCSFNTVTASMDGDNIRKLFVSISGSCTPTTVRTVSGSWYARSHEKYVRESYICRVHANEFNYSNNYTYSIPSDLNVLPEKFKFDSITYITSIGLYNSNRDLVAVGKLKRPLYKDSTTEYVFQVRVRNN
jgi:hypothetical protein